MASAITYHENFGQVSRAQLAAYRKFNVSPADHDDLTDAFGEDHEAITKAVKKHSEGGMYSTPWGGFKR